ncbi:MAG: hypothetical protein ACYC26_12320 [Phycisphaerales bacterium]
MPRHARLFRIIGFSALALIGVLLIAGFIGWRKWHAVPGYWHVAAKGTEADAAQAERFENWVAAELHAVRPPATASDNGDSPDQTWAMQLDADQINQWLIERLPTWAANQNIKLPAWLEHPMVAMEHDRLIVAAQVRRGELTQIVSLVYRPSRPNAGPVTLDLVTIRGGTLGLPAGALMDVLLEQVKPDEREKLRSQLQHIPLQIKLSDRRHVVVEQMTVEQGSVTMRCRTETGMTKHQ